MGLRLTVLGSSGSYADAGRACSGYLVRSATTTIWIDAGSGTFANLQQHADPRDVAAIVITHEHPDHWVDTTGFYVAAKYYLGVPEVAVYAPASVRNAVYYDGPPFHWHQVASGDQRMIGDLRLTFSRTDHPVETLAVRVDGDGSSLGYSADTAAGWSLSALGDDLDLALCEATFLQDEEGRGHHMSARQAGATAREAGAKRLIITHVQPGVDHGAARAEAEVAFGGPVEVAVEHMEVDL